MEFPAKLRKLMHDQRYSQGMLADRLEVSQNLVSRWTRGASVPDLATAKVLADLFGVDVDFLADDALDRPAPRPEPWELRLWEVIRSLGPDEAWRRLLQAPAPTSGPVEYSTGREVLGPGDARKGKVG